MAIKVRAEHPLPSWADALTAELRRSRRPRLCRVTLPYTPEPLYIVSGDREARRARQHGYREVWTAASAREWFALTL